MALRASPSAKPLPKTSPSGFSWAHMTKRSCSRMAVATGSTASDPVETPLPPTVLELIPLAYLIDHVADSHAALDRTIANKRERWRAPGVQPLSKLSTQEAGGRLQALHRLARCALVAHRACVDTRRSQSGTHICSKNRHEADARVLQLFVDDLAQLTHDLVLDPHETLAFALRLLSHYYHRTNVRRLGDLCVFRLFVVFEPLPCCIILHLRHRPLTNRACPFLFSALHQRVDEL